MDDVRALGTTFTPRPAPDAASYVRRSISASPYRYVARVRYFAPQDFVAQYFPAGSATIESDGADACVVTAGADDPQRMALFFAMVGCDFEVAHRERRPVMPSRSLSNRNAAAKSLSAVASRTRSQSTCSRTARIGGSNAAKSQ